jgi:hypothetical protein
MCGRYTLTADMKKVADRFGAPMPAEEHLNAQPRKGFGAGCSTRNTQRSSERIGDWDEEGNRLLRSVKSEPKGRTAGWASPPYRAEGENGRDPILRRRTAR